MTTESRDIIAEAYETIKSAKNSAELKLVELSDKGKVIEAALRLIGSVDWPDVQDYAAEFKRRVDYNAKGKGDSIIMELQRTEATARIDFGNIAVDAALQRLCDEASTESAPVQ